MFSKAQMALKFGRYWWQASNAKGHGIHSPFVYQLVREVMNPPTESRISAGIEAVRQHNLRNQQVLTIEDLGAGSRTAATRQRQVSEIARHALKPPRFAQLFHRLIAHQQLTHVVELGTSLGITTAYLAAAHKNVELTTMEGAPAVAEVAKRNLAQLGINNVHVQVGNFDQLLPNYLEKITQLDFGFVDGNHRLEPTVRYFEQMLAKCHEGSVLVFDDIHWSAEMEQAWETIKAHPQVTLTIDLFFIGLVFFRKEQQQKEHFLIRYA